MKELTTFHERKGIRFEGDYYLYGEYKYKDLEPAVEYAIKVTGLSEADFEDFSISQECC